MKTLKEDLLRRIAGFLLLPALVAVAVFAARPALADVIQDQAQEEGPFVNFLNENSYVAQSFTVGVAGILDHIDVRLRAPFEGAQGGRPNYNILFGLQSASGGVPDGTDLATGVVTPDQLTLADDDSSGSYISFDVGYAGINVSAGDVFAFVLHGDPGSVGSPAGDWNILVTSSSGSDVYSGGSKFSGSPGSWSASTNSDAQFLTFVNTGGPTPVPEPATLALLAIGVAGLGALRRRPAA